LPEDFSGPIRLVTIQSEDKVWDANLCCGTHVLNLAELQVVKLVGVEKAKKEGRFNVKFAVGERVLGLLQASLHREKVFLL